MTYHDLLALNQIYRDVFIHNRFTPVTKAAAQHLEKPRCGFFIGTLAEGNLEFPKQVLKAAKSFAPKRS